MSTLTVKNLQGTYPTNQINIPAGHKIVTQSGGLYAPGHVLNVSSVTKTDTFSSSSTSDTLITGLSITVTPISTSSKFLISYSVPISLQGGAYSATIRIARNGSVIAVGDQEGSSRVRSTSHIWSDYYNYAIFEANKNFLDSPTSTSQTTYTVLLSSPYGVALYVNRSYSHPDSYQYGTAISTFTVMEVGQ